MNRTLLNNKLKSYSAVAGTIVATAASADAQIMYTDVNPDVTLTVSNTQPATYDVDFDGDSNADLVVAAYGLLAQGTIQLNLSLLALQPNQTAAILGYDDQGYTYTTALASGTFIDPASTSWYDTTALAGTTIASAAVAPSVSASYGQFPTGNDGYVGARFVLGANTHYGWVRIQVAADGTTTIVKDYAYKTTPNTGLNAGESGLGINEMPATNWFTSVNGKNIVVSAKVDGKLNVIDATGRLVATGNVENGQAVIALPDASTGIFVVSFENNGTIGTKKVILN